MKMSRKSLLLVVGGVLLIMAIALGAWLYPHYALHAHQAQVAAHGAQVMPFDLDQTHHMFDPLDDGGLQTVTANDPSNEEQIGLIQEHLAEIAQEFQEGNYEDPAKIHGHQMPGLEKLKEGASRMEITYTVLPDGGQIRYRSEEPELISAIHDWFKAQVSDHGQHASDH